MGIAKAVKSGIYTRKSGISPTLPKPQKRYTHFPLVTSFVSLGSKAVFYSIWGSFLFKY